ncbi:glycosyltransferase family 4 protein [Methanoculleus taiwanensis]|uniref:glycosyltransferase family 4 protein n=1 Tax=Methanoculleus taiwanensis TaxID=1550565 RepID=UPI001F4F2370|nr:glycosyltransferase family 4 protein [Methanoculleus taiwanensis]
MKIVGGALWADVVFCWFAHNHAYLAVLASQLLGRRSIVVIGGYEVAREPKIGYGSLLDPVLSRRIRYILNHADSILAVSEFNRVEIEQIARPRALETVYNGIDCSVFSPNGGKEDLVLTVCLVNRANIAIKGLDTFVRVARYFPEIRFVVAGSIQDDSLKVLGEAVPGNVEFTGALSQEELLSWYRRARVYCQLSYRESFGVALAEAMACECVPVATDRGALPEVVGDTGFIVPYGDVEATADAVACALNADTGRMARERVQHRFSLESREERLVQAIEGQAV